MHAAVLYQQNEYKFISTIESIPIYLDPIYHIFDPSPEIWSAISAEERNLYFCLP